MGKLFALEDDSSSSGNDLIIDKLLQKNEQKKSPLSLTADLLKQRNEINNEVKDELEKQEEEDQSDTETDDNSEVENNSEDDQEQDKDPDENKDDKEINDDSAAEDKDDLNSLVGSGLKEDDGDDKKEDDSKKTDEVAEESFRSNVSIRSIFKPLQEASSRYTLSLEDFNLADKAVPIEKQPIAYVKDAVLECFDNLTKVSFKYVQNTDSFLKTISDSVLKLNERLTVFNGLVEGGKYHFTHKLVKEKDVLEQLSYKDHSDIRETSRVLLRYIEQSNIAVSLMVNNSFEEMKSAFTSKDFTEDGTDLVFSKQLPGFNLVKVATEPYINYLKTKPENFQYYKLKTVKAEDLYSLTAISVSEDKDLEYIVKTLNDLVAVAAVSIDTLKGVSGHFTSFTDELKVLSFNVQKDQYTNLTEIGIDEKVKDFIKFKLAMEASFININMILDYITSAVTVLNTCLELSE